MIKVYGPQHGKERRIAERLETMDADWCPKASTSTTLNIDIFCSVSTPGESKADIDILLSMWCTGRSTFPTISSGSRAFEIDNLVGIVELKEHTAGGVRFSGTGVEVRYGTKWESVTESLKQRGPTLRNYLTRKRFTETPFIPCAAWMTNLDRGALPIRFDNEQVLTGESDFEAVVAALKSDRLKPINAQSTSFGSTTPTSPTFHEKLRERFGSEHEATPLTRKRFEAVNQKWLSNQRYVDDIGKKMVLITGTAGSGKTVTMLRFGRDLIRDFGRRIIVTSFNTALLNDLRGQVKSWTRGDWEEFFRSGQLTFLTVHALTNQIAARLGVESERGANAMKDSEREAWLKRVLAEVDRLGDDVRELIDITDEQGSRITISEAFLLVDEAQDVMPVERDLLLRIFGPERCVIAYSDYQVQRMRNATPWAQLPHLAIKLRKVRRSTALLVEFAAEIASVGNVRSNDEREPDRDFIGGQIIVVVGDYFRQPELHKRLLRQLSEAENHPTDLLFIVPPGDRDHERASTSTVAKLEPMSYPVWNGTQKEVRSKPQTSRQQIRVINYQSGRGLEAWTVVTRGLDDYFEWLLKHQPGFAEITPELFPADTALRIEEQVMKRIMMPLTRPIDTLVIELRQGNSRIASFVREAAKNFGAAVEWVE